MKKLLLGLALTAITSLTTQAANFSYHDLDTINVTLNSGNPDYDAADGNNTFNIAAFDGSDDGVFGPDAYNPVTQTLTSGTAVFTFSNGANFADIRVDLGTQNNFASGQSVLLAGLGGDIGVTLLAQLGVSGQLTYTVHLTSGATSHVKFVSAELDATGVSKSVPDGGSSVMLLGSALIGMATLVRRKS